jgi:DNA-binding MarR family transcriptional regulator
MSKFDNKSGHTVSDEVLIAIRRVIRAIDLHSRQLNQIYGLTGPQALVLKEISNQRGISAGELARRVSLSQATITDIVKRLEQRGYVARIRDLTDRRKVLLEISRAGSKLVKTAPPLLQERFTERFSKLGDWEQTLLLSSLQRIAALMDAGELEAEPVLASSTLTVSAEDVSGNGGHSAE